MTPGDVGSLIGGIVSVIGMIAGWLKVVRPWLKQRKINHLLKEANDNAIRDVIIGRPGGLANAITGEAGRAPLPGMAQRLNEVFDRIAAIEKLSDITIETRIITLEDYVTELQARMNHLYKLAEKHHPE